MEPNSAPEAKHEQASATPYSSGPNGDALVDVAAAAAASSGNAENANDSVSIYTTPFESTDDAPPTPESLHANVIRPCGYSSAECGYCRGQRSHLLQESKSRNGDIKNSGKEDEIDYASSGSYGTIVDCMECGVYERFLYRGWRRSGLHMYKPTLEKSCCPAISIRLPVEKFTPTKSQKRLRKRSDRFGPRDEPKSQQSKPTTAKTKTDDQYESAVRYVMSSSALDVLKNAVVKALESNPIIASSSVQGSWRTLAHFKKKPKSQLGNFEKLRRQSSPDAIMGNGRSSDSTTVAFATSVCAVLAGQNQDLNRGALSQELVRILSQSKNHFEDERISIESFERHEGSGQVWALLNVSFVRSDLTGQAEKEFLTKESRSPGVQRSLSNVSMKNCESEKGDIDRLADWFKRTIGREISSPDNRKITMTTIPAHKSALDPDVFSLYALYQTVVHDDPDPFTGAMKNGAHTPRGEPLKASMTVAEATASKFPSALAASLSPSLTQSPPQVDYGSDSSAARILQNARWTNSPPGWGERAKNMLLQLCQKYPQHAHSAIIACFDNFYHFLVESPFPLAPLYRRRQPSNESSSTAPGTYHQHYKIDGVLIAVGVVDILPFGLSSVYFLYHPSFAHELLPLGKLAILREIEYTRDLGLPYYYLGYYIESCWKMRYKADYRPSQLLCPKTYQWVDTVFGQARMQNAAPRHACSLVQGGDKTVVRDSQPHPPRRRIQNGHAQVGSDFKISQSDGARTNVDLNQVVMDIGAGIDVTIGMLQEGSQMVIRSYLEEFVAEAGPDLSLRCVVKFK